MLELEPAGSAADLGCGSGVLAIAAAKLGWDPVVAVDHDPAALEAASANAAANRLELEVRRLDLRREKLPGTWLAVANVSGQLVRELGPALRVAAPRVVIASGFLGSESDGVARALAAAGLAERGRRASAEWGALLLAR
jgi:ribosomal protein L11 methyltransferase